MIVVLLAACATEPEAPVTSAVAEGGAPGAEVAAGTELDAFDELGAPLRIRVDAIEPDPLDPNHELHLYTVSVKDAAGSWVPYCSADPYGSRQAIAAQGTWDAQGRWVDAPRVTVACTAGVIAKCIRWGYQPWKSVEGQSLRDYHQACMRMARADYCGDGTPHTKTGTYIQTWDRIGIQKIGRDRPVEFEAGWGPDGATYLHVPRWTDDVESIVRECPDKLAGRVAEERGAPLSPEEIAVRFPETLMFNEHAANDDDRQRYVPLLGGSPPPLAPDTTSSRP